MNSWMWLVGMVEISSMLITHKKATIGDMERAWHGGVEELLQQLISHDLVEECAVLKTCNRVEIYVVSPKGSKVLLAFAQKMNVSSRIVDFLDHEESLRHLLYLASGLESMIVGEDQILGQMKELYNIAKRAGTLGRVLDTALSKAIHVGKRVRRETRINKGSVSIGSAAVELAEDLLGGLEGRRVMVIGAGRMGSLVAKAIASKDLDVIYVANRTFERAERLAESLHGLAVPYHQFSEYMKECDVVIVATSAPHNVVNAEMISGVVTDRNERLILIDIGNPRNVDRDVNDLEGVDLYDIDDLKGISERNMQQRIEEVKHAKDIIEEELQLLNAEYKRQKADKIISDLYKKVERIKEAECREAINKLSAYHTIGEIEKKVIYDLTRSFSNQILAEPTKVLRSAAEDDDDAFLNTAALLFNLNGKEEKKRK